jgi:hypothetical protein
MQIQKEYAKNAIGIRLTKIRKNNMRNKIEIFNNKAENLVTALGITPERVEVLTGILKELTKELKRLSDVLQVIWDNQNLSNEEVAYCILNIGINIGELPSYKFKTI